MAEPSPQIATIGPRTGTGNTTYTDHSSLVAGNTYAYRVKAVNGAVSSAYSNTASVTVPTPSGGSFWLDGSRRESRHLRHRHSAWTDNANNETSFTIQRSTNATFTQNVVTINNVPSNSTSYVQTGVSRRTTFYYRIRAANAAGTSAWSNVASVTTP